MDPASQSFHFTHRPMRVPCSKLRFILLVQAFSLSLCAAQSDSIVVPLLRAPGFGPFTPVTRLTFPGENTGGWERAIEEVRGVPVDLHGFSIRYMNLQMDQYVFQSYRAGLIDPLFARDLIARNSYDTTKLTPKHVDQDVPVVVGLDGDGNTVYVVDTKPDHSFWGKDRIVLPPLRPGALTRAQMDSLNALIEKPVVTFEFYDGKKIREGEVALCLSPYVNVPEALAQEVRGKIVFGISTYEYRRGVFKSGERPYMCAVSNGFQSGVYGGRRNEFTFFPSEDSNTVSPASSLLYRLGDRVEIADEVFRIASVAADGSSLTLRREKVSRAGEGIAVGSAARDFEGRTLTGGEVSLRQFRGKYVLLEFWFPGSSTCAAEMPYLNDIHAAYGDTKIQVLGMALAEGPAIPGFIAEHLMQWTQVPLRDTSRVLRDYAVGGYPAAFLIDPQGKIVENGRFRGQELYNRIARALADSGALMSMIEKGNVVFRFEDGRTKSVEVAGDFTGWLPLPMYRGAGGFFRHVAISPGRYRYRFIVDGKWMLDPTNDTTEESTSGMVNNILVVR
jgi:peroxiredoxin